MSIFSHLHNYVAHAIWPPTRQSKEITMRNFIVSLSAALAAMSISGTLFTGILV